MFFPDESEGANPFGVLGAPPPVRDADPDGLLLAQAVEAAAAVQSALPHLAGSADSQLRLEGPMQELVEQLLRPGTVQDFLAQREAVRSQSRRRRRGASARTWHASSPRSCASGGSLKRS